MQDFTYRLPETNSIRSQRIEIGGQIQISGNLSTLEIDAVVEQHRKYGLVAVEDIDRTKPFIGVCFSVDKPVSTDKIRIAMMHNTEVLIDRGRQNRQEAAIAVSNQLEETAPNLTSLEMSVVEERKDGSTPEFAEGVRVTRRDQPGRPPQPPQRQGNRQQRRAGGG